MKKHIIFAIAVLAFSLVLSGCSSSDSAITSNSNSTASVVTEVEESVVIPDTAITKTFDVADMYCAGCAFGIQAAMLEIDGVYKANVDYETATGDVTYDPEMVSEEQLIEAALPYTLTF